MSQKYSREEISRHNREEDLWIILHGRVYDLTKFLKEHPGGEEVLTSLAGDDGTTCFDDIGHSEEAKLLKDNYEIGEVDDSVVESPKTPSKKEPPEMDDNWTYQEPKKDSSYMFYVFVGVAILIYAIVFYFMFN